WSDGNGPFQGFNDIDNRYPCRIPGQDVPSIHTVLRNEQTLSSQLLQHFSQQLRWNVILRRYLAGANPLFRMHRQMLHRDQAIICFLGEPKHRNLYLKSDRIGRTSSCNVSLIRKRVKNSIPQTCGSRINSRIGWARPEIPPLQLELWYKATQNEGNV